MESQPNIPTYEELIYGGKHYKTILQVLRDSLSIGLESKLKEKYGAIAFFKYDIESEGIKMNFFPLFPEVIDLNFPDDKKLRLEYLKRINEDRPVSQIYYVEHFRNTYNCTEHTVLDVGNDDDLLNHTKDIINGVSWSDFIKQKNLEVNRLDFLFFKKRQKTFTLFPLPVLCSPCILLFLPYNDRLGIEDLTPLVRDAINNYVFNRLMSEIRSDLKPAAIPNREAFIKRFVDEFNQVALPIKFEYKGKKHNFIDWYGKFKTDDAAELELNLDGEVVKFFLPSFCWHTGQLLHTLPQYKVKEQQVKETIQNIFGVVYSNWEAINNTKAQGRIAVKQILEDSGLNLSLLNSVGGEIEKVRIAIESAVNISEAEYNSTLTKISSKTTYFKKIYDNGVEVGYKVIFNDDVVAEYLYPKSKTNKKLIKHFGYEAFEEIISKGEKRIAVTDFSFFEEVRNVLHNKQSPELSNGNQKKKVDGIDNDADMPNIVDEDKDSVKSQYGDSLALDAMDIISTTETLKGMLNTIGISESTLSQLSVDDFKSKVSNLDYVKNEVSNFKKSIDQLKRSIPSNINVKGLTDASKYINLLHNYFVKNLEGYAQWHSSSGTTIIASNARRLSVSRGVGDNRVVEKICNNIHQLCNKLATDAKHGDVFKNNFSQAELNYNKSDRNFQYKKSLIELKYTLQWVFE